MLAITLITDAIIFYAALCYEEMIHYRYATLLRYDTPLTYARRSIFSAIYFIYGHYTYCAAAVAVAIGHMILSPPGVHLLIRGAATLRRATGYYYVGCR